MAVFDLKAQLTFYCSYHHNAVNKIIHIACIPVIMWTILVLLSPLSPPSSFLPEYLAFDFSFNSPIPLKFNVNGASIIATAYLLYYVILDPIASLLYVPVVMLEVGTATWYAANGERPLMIATGVQVLGWIAQFVGHGVFEKRAPALLDNLLQAFVLAPFFVWIEILFMFGYRPALKTELNLAVDRAVRDWKRQSFQKRVRKKAE